MIFLPYPVPLNRAYRNFRGVTVLSVEGKAWKKHAAWQAKASGMKLIEGAVKVSLILHPKTKKNGDASKTRCDLDSVMKLCFDALNCIAWHDDKQVEHITVSIGSPVMDGGLTVEVSEL